MQDHHLSLCIIFIIIIFIAPSHKEKSIVMAYRSPKNLIDFFFFVYLVHCLCNIFFLYCLFFVMYCLTLIHR